MRFPRINRLRWDKRPRDADQIQTLEKLLAPAQASNSLTGEGAPR
jgi:DNA ligase-1